MHADGTCSQSDARHCNTKAQTKCCLRSKDPDQYLYSWADLVDIWTSPCEELDTPYPFPVRGITGGITIMLSKGRTQTHYRAINS